MVKLMDIKGYLNKSGSLDFNDNNMWEGKILLNEDGWFEGIAVDPNSSYTGDRFIFGVYHPEKVIELFLFAPICISTPYVFHGSRDVKGYDGKFETIGLSGTVPCGFSHIITQYADSVRENTDTESCELDNRIKRYKQSIMDETCRDFYDNSISIRDIICQLVLKRCGGDGSFPIETQQVINEYKLFKDTTTDATNEQASKLVKK